LASAGSKWSNSSASFTLPVHVNNNQLQRSIYFTLPYQLQWSFTNCHCTSMILHTIMVNFSCGIHT
jgi:hypothetical protein